MLTPRQTDLLRSLVNRIIPPDDYPGGWEGGVGDYLFGQFKRDLKHLQSVYALGLDALDAEAVATSGTHFDALAPAEADTLLSRIEVGQVITPWPVDPIAFFWMACHHCAEGYYSDPGNDGNRDQVAWTMIGFEVRG
jgi:hypothetical protein